MSKWATHNQKSTYVQNEHYGFPENKVKLIEKERLINARSAPFKHREHRKEAKFANKMQDKMEREAENHWSILSKI